MEVLVVIFLELNWEKVLGTNSEVFHIELLQEFRENLLVLRSCWLFFLFFLVLFLFSWKFNFDCLWFKVRYFNSCSTLGNKVSISVLSDPKVESNKVSTSSHKMDMECIVGVESNWGGSSLGARPEGVPVFVLGVMREYAQKVLDLEVEQVFKVESSYFNALLEVS